MVHALSEARRVLRLGGSLIDLRPTPRDRVVQLERDGERVFVGEIDSSASAGGKRAADDALALAIEKAWFRAEHHERFDTVTALDGLDDLLEFSRRLRHSVMPAALPERIARLSAGASDSLIRIRREMIVARYRRL